MKKFSIQGSFKIGLGSTQPGNLQHLGKPGFVKHNFKNTAAYIAPVEEQSGQTRLKKLLHRMAMEILMLIDPEYAAGETIVQFALLTSPQHRVDKHVDDEDISFQYAVSLGNYHGAILRTYNSSGRSSDIDNRNKIVRFDGRLPHEVVVDPGFVGERFTVIWYQNYDARKTQPDPILEKPQIAWHAPISIDDWRACTRIVITNSTFDFGSIRSLKRKRDVISCASNLEEGDEEGEEVNPATAEQVSV